MTGNTASNTSVLMMLGDRMSDSARTATSFSPAFT